MVLICSRTNRYEILFVVAVAMFSQVSCQFPRFFRKGVGSSHTFVCPGDLTKNYTYTFYKTIGVRLVIKPSSTSEIIQNVLIKSDLKFPDSGLYSCSVAYPNGTKIGGDHELGILSIAHAPKIAFEMLPTVSTSTVDEGESFEFRCEYGKTSTKFVWEKRQAINGTQVTSKVDRNLITVINNTTMSIEVYSFEKVSKQDTGTYRCLVTENSNSRATRPRVLEVREKTAPAFKDVKDIFYGRKNKDVTVAFELDGVPSPNISCYRDSIPVIFCSGADIENTGDSKGDVPACSKDNYRITGHQIFLIKNALFSLNDGLYKCVASNVVGSDSVEFHVNISAPPMISRTNSQFFPYEENEVGSVKCIIHVANPRPKVMWFQQDLPHVGAEPEKNKWISSLHPAELVSVGKGKYESTLEIPWQEGPSFYRCTAKNNVGNDSRIFRFLRFGIGEEPFVVFPSDAVVNEGEQFVARCRVAVAIGRDWVFYREDNQAVVENSNRTNVTSTQDSKFRNITMVVTDLGVNDSGIYRCGELVSTSDYAATKLIVKALRPPVILDLKNQSVQYIKDNKVVLFCNVTGNPCPEVRWLRNGRPTGARQVVSSCDQLEPGFYYFNTNRTKLAICDPSLEHRGVYTCAIKNQLGNVKKDVYLEVFAKPMFEKPKFKTKKELAAGESFELPCLVEGNPPPLVQWILEDGMKEMTHESYGVSKLELEKMDESYVGNYSCRAWNSLGMIMETFLELKLKPPDGGPESLSSGSGMAIGTIVGIVVAVTVVLIIIFLIIFYCYRSQQKKLLFYKHQYFLRTGDYSIDPKLTLNEQTMNLPYDSDWEFPFERLVLQDRLGAGAFGEVYKGEAMGILALNPRDKSGLANKRRSKIRRSLRASQRPKKKAIPPDLSNAVVAVKTVKAQATENEIRDLAAELKLMIHIGEHKNIVNLLGACTTGRKLYVILEFCPHGNLLSFLRSKRHIYDNTWIKQIYDPEKEFTLIDIVGAAFQIAKGMEFLAARKLIHRDLAARNILVADEYVMKIADFGLARDIYNNDVYVKTSSGMLPVKWMAVESLFDRVYTHQSDVWSFGVLLWEMMTLGGTPYPNLPAEQLLDFLNEGKRMPQPAKCPLEVYAIMRDCWQELPENRPTFANLVEKIGRMLERHLEKVNPYLRVEAKPEEIEAAKERDLLLKPKSDYYLQPMLMSKNILGYDPNAPLPTPPTDSYSGSPAPLPEVDMKPSSSELREAGSYARLREDSPAPQRVPRDDESGIGLEEMNGGHHGVDLGKNKKIESVV